MIRKKEDEKMETVIKAVVVGILTVVIAALNQNGGEFLSYKKMRGTKNLDIAKNKMEHAQVTLY